MFQNVNVQDGELPEDAVQIQPQHVKLRIRPSESSALIMSLIVFLLV